MVFGNQSLQGYESNRWVPKEFEWKIFPGITALGLLEKIQNLMRGLQCEPEHFEDRIIFMSMFNDVVCDAKGNEAPCEHNAQAVANYARKIPRGHWPFLGPGSKEKVERNLYSQTRWIMGSNGREHDGKFLSIGSSDISCLKCLCWRRFTTQRRTTRS